MLELVCLDPVLWCRPQNSASSLRTVPNSRQVQGQGPHAVPNYIVGILFVIACHRTSHPSISPRPTEVCSATSVCTTLGTASQIPGISGSPCKREESSSREGDTGERVERPSQGNEDRVGAEEPDSGEHCSPEDDWKLCWKAARYALARQRSKHPDKREHREEAQQAGSVLVGGRSVCLGGVVVIIFLPCAIYIHCSVIIGRLPRERDFLDAWEDK